MPREEKEGVLAGRSRQRTYGLTVVVALTALLLAASADATPTTRFVSKQYGYSIVLPGRANQWQTNFALVTWSSGVIDPGLPAFDTFTEIQTQRAYVIGARRLPAGSVLEKWTSLVISERPTHCRAAPAGRPRDSTLSGAPARLFTFSCTDGFTVTAITALHARRGYFMFVASPTTLSAASDRRAFVAARGSFHFLSA